MKNRGFSVGHYLGGTKVPGAQSSVQATSSATPLMTGSGVTATFNDLLLTGAAAPTYPAASVVLTLTQSSNVTVTNSAIYGGTGSAAPPAGPGVIGSPGGNGGDYTAPTAGTSQCGNQGGTGASGWPVSGYSNGCSFLSCCSGCSAGANWVQDAYGAAGTGAGSGAASPMPTTTACAASPTITAASAGSPGTNATATALPSANLFGSLSADGIWSPVVGDNGNQGTNGSGGGGGGAGVGYFRAYQNLDCNFTSRNGMGGGGGGGGGCAATVGSGGQMGGASFAVVLVSSAINMTTNVTVTGAQGGNGGPGGAGAVGGASGIGGANCNCTLSDGSPAANCSANCDSGSISGAGGNGGLGGDSGGGAGGNGGPTVGIVLATESTMQKPQGIYPNSSGALGNGGGNGGGVGPVGAIGLAGLAQGQYSVPE